MTGPLALPNHIPSLEEAFSSLPSAPTLAREFGYGWNNIVQGTENINGNLYLSSLRPIRRRVRSANVFSPITRSSRTSSRNNVNSLFSTNHVTTRNLDITRSTETSQESIPDYIVGKCRSSPTFEAQHGKYTAQSKEKNSQQFPSVSKEVSEFGFSHSYHSALPFTYTSKYISCTNFNSPRIPRNLSAPICLCLDRTTSDPSPSKNDSISVLDRRMNVRLDKLLNAAVVSIQPHDGDSRR